MDNVEIVPCRQEGADWLLDWIDNEKLLYQWSGSEFTFPLSKEQLERYMAKAEKEDTYHFQVEADGKIVGHASLGRVDLRHQTGRLGKVFIAPPYNGKGFAKEMIKQILAFAYEQLDLHRISLGVFNFNIPAIKLYESFGFQKEGLLRDVIRINGSFWNVYEMSLLRPEWETLIATTNDKQSGI
ncbi:GNAT family N-acetyltransferase [Halalkalibacterium ligniniphilum]|uniref:GNAT family N-acetyltransferase n=1 Tax=Halalkalibacterium ligniniphilum TaxID=1134413 RepID=UPI00034663A7|nr:GNAT family protein [Halalkalibacterium ligniniphilum]